MPLEAVDADQLICPVANENVGLVMPMPAMPISVMVRIPVIGICPVTVTRHSGRHRARRRLTEAVDI